MTLSLDTSMLAATEGSGASANAGATSAAIGTTSLDLATAVNATYDIVVHYSGDPAFQSAFDLAAQVWQEIITADLPDVNSARYGFIDDLLIDASAVPIDGAGNILGQAGPDDFRSGSSLPDHGVMQFDSADLQQMSSSGILTDVIIHEMGHILGIGTLWATKGLKSGFTYTGTNALAEYRTLTGNASASSVPLETGGGSGTAGAHWSEATFGSELMTGYVGSAPNPLSRMTIASLKDLGYSVNIGMADPYSLPGHALTDDFSGTSRTTGQVTVGSSRTGTIEVTGDRDWFKVQLTAGVTYLINLDGAATAAGTLADPYLRLHDSTGKLLAQDDNAPSGSLNALLTVTAATSGVYYVEAGGSSDAGTGSYRVSVNPATTTNHAPVITSDGGGSTATLIRAENAIAVTVVTASDQDAGTVLSFALVAGADAAKFHIDASGALSFITAPDFEAPSDSDHNNSYVVQVQVSDNASPNLSDTQTITVNVIDVNEGVRVDAGPHGDFSGDHKADLLLHGADGTVSIAQLNGGQVASNTNFGVVGPEWHIESIADFDGSGGSDVLWRGNDGTVASWLMNGTQITVNTSFGVVGPEWHILGTADMNGDGKADIFWRGDDGTLALWQMDGNRIVNNAALGTISADWHLVAIADFGGDHKSDLLWRNDSGALALWQMNGSQVVSTTNLGTVATQQHVVGAGDFNGDGKADILWRADDGSVSIWQMNGGAVQSNQPVGIVGNEWHVDGTGDFSGDGKADILWRNDAGVTGLWVMDGGYIVSQQTIAALPATSTFSEHHYDFV